MSPKIKLDDDFYFREASVYGIVSELADYRLCHYLNRDLCLRLARSEDDHKHYYKGRTLIYSEYRYFHPVYQTHWMVTSNKKPFYSESNFPERVAVVLVPDQQMYD